MSAKATTPMAFSSPLVPGEVRNERSRTSEPNTGLGFRGHSPPAQRRGMAQSPKSDSLIVLVAILNF